MAAECDTKSLFHKTVKLHEWWLVWAENENHEKKLAICGHTFCGQGAVRVFSSSPILRRHDVFTLETTDGIYVSILGLINKTRTEEHGFPSEVFKCFFFGFPLHWEVCAEQYLAQGFVSNDISRDDSNLKGSTQTIEECNATNVGANVSPLSTDPKLDKDPALCPIREGSQTVMYRSEKDPGWEKTTDIEMESKFKENTDIREASKAERKVHNNVSSEDANLKGCSNANAQINVMTNARINVSLANTDPKLDQDHTACMILEGSKNSNEAIEYINRAGGAKDTAQKKTADIERESNFKENAIYEEARTATEKTYNNVPSEDASLNGCSNAIENTNEMNNTKANDTLANTNPELDQDQRKTVAIEKESIMEENTASKKASTAGNNTCTDPSRRLREILKKSNTADRFRTRSGGPKNTTTTVKRKSTSIKKAASKETSTPDKNTQRKLAYMAIRGHIDVTIDGRSFILNKLYNELEVGFQEYLDDSRDSRCLLNLLKIPGADLITPLVKYVLRFYDTKDHVFRINGLVFCITLEDVLYLTGLPIQGTPVICDKNRDPNGFQRVFQLPEHEKTPSITTLKRIAKDANLDYATRKKAVLLLIVRCFIAPICGGHRVSPTFIRFIEDFLLVDSYAWGAALLAFLYHGIGKSLDNKPKNATKSIDGNCWVILGFFLLRIPLLQVSLGLNLRRGELDVPILRSIVEQVRAVSFNHWHDYTQQSDILSSLNCHEVNWTPYTRVRDEQRMDQARNGTYIGPIICNNYVAYHKPHLAHLQFPVLENCDVDARVWKPKKIKPKKNKGGSEQNLFRHYSKEIESWNSMVLAQSYFPASEEAGVVEDFDDNEPFIKIIKRISGKKRKAKKMDATENAPCDLDSLEDADRDYDDRDRDFQGNEGSQGDHNDRNEGPSIIQSKKVQNKM